MSNTPVNKSDGSPLTSVPDGATDATSTSLTLFGVGADPFVEALNEDLLHLAESWSSATAPSPPLTGQVWHDPSTGYWSGWDGGAWVHLGQGAVDVGAILDAANAAVDAASSALNEALGELQASFGETQGIVTSLQDDAAQLFADTANASTTLADLIASNAAIYTTVANLSSQSNAGLANALQQIAVYSNAATSLAGSFTAFETITNGSVAALNSNVITLTTDYQAISGDLTSYKASVGNSIATLNQNASIQANSIQSISAVQTTLSARIDGANATVMQEAVARAANDAVMAGQISLLTLNLANANVAISSETAARISNAGVLAGRIDSLTVGLAGANASVLSEQTARIANNVTLSGRLDVVSSVANGAMANVATESVARIANDAVLSGQITTVQANLNGTNAVVQTETAARISNAGILAAQIGTVQANLNGANSVVQTETSARVANDAVLSGQISTVQANLNGANAVVQAEATARISNNAILAGQITTVQANLNGANTAISTEAANRISNDAAVAQTVSNLQAQIGSSDGRGAVTGRLETVETVTTNGTFATAASQQTLTAQVSQPSVNSNPNFSAWPSGQALPTGYSSWTTSSYTSIGTGTLSPYCIIQSPSAGSQVGFAQYGLRKTRGWCVLEATVRIKGSFIGAGVGWYSSNEGLLLSFSSDPDINGVVRTTSENDYWVYTWRKLVQAGQEDYGAALYGFTAYSGLGDVSSTRSILWDHIAIRAATDGEVAGKRADGNASAALAQINLNYNTQASVNGAQATTNQVLTAKTSGNSNLCPFGNFEQGLGKWSGFGSGAVAYADANYGWLTYLGQASGTWGISSQTFGLSPNQTYTLSGNIQCSSGATCYLDVIGFDSNNNIIFDGPQTAAGRGLNFAASGPNYVYTFSTPANVVSGQVRMIINSNGANNNLSSAYAQHIKLEVGTQWTPYTSEATAAIQSGTLVDAYNRTRAYTNISTTAGGSTALVSLNADGYAGSSIGLLASSIALYAQGGGSAIQALNVNSSGLVTIPMLAAGQISTNNLTVNAATKQTVVAITSAITGTGGPSSTTAPSTPPPAGGNGSCPAPETRILLADGQTTKAAGDLLPGDMLWTRHEFTGEWGIYEVVGVASLHSARTMWREIIASPDHPILKDGEWVTFEELDAEPVEDGLVVRLTIEDAHTYVIVTPDGERIVSHNKQTP